MTAKVSRALRTAWAATMCAALLTPAYAGKAKTSTSPEADWKSYKTYSWLPTKALTKSGLVEEDPVFGPAMRTAINAELTARGFREVPEGGDLQVSAIVLSASVPQLEAVYFPGGLWMDYATPIATMGRYNREGTLAINLIDARTKKYAWAGVVTENVDRDPGSGLKKIAPAAHKIFDKFPFKAKQ